MSLEHRWVLTYVRNLKCGDLVRSPVSGLKTERVISVSEKSGSTPPTVEVTFSAEPNDYLTWFFKRKDPVEFYSAAFIEVDIMTEEGLT